MTTGEGVSTLEHLAEMDRLLRDIQLELAPDREPAPALAALPPTEATAPPPPTKPAAPPTPGAAQPPSAVSTKSAHDRDAQLQAVTQLAARLLASMRELLDGYEQVLVPIRRAAPPPPPDPPTPPTPPAPDRPSARAADPEVTVAAGPFATLEALREFEQAVARLPGVRNVAVRGYEGADRAIIEVRLAPPGR